MAKKKKVMDEPMAVIEEEEVLTPSVPMEEEEIQPEVVSREDDTDVFIRTQLKVINNMSDKAKAKRLAARVLRNRKG